MPNGKSLISDLEMLTAFEEPFIVNGIPRDQRLYEKYNLHWKQLYRLCDKPKFDTWIECGVSFRSGWLTEAGKAELARLRNSQ